jgi:hypothetical protein
MNVVEELLARLSLGTSGILMCQAYISGEARAAANKPGIVVLHYETLVQSLEKTFPAAI